MAGTGLRSRRKDWSNGLTYFDSEKKTKLLICIQLITHLLLQFVILIKDQIKYDNKF